MSLLSSPSGRRRSPCIARRVAPLVLALSTSVVAEAAAPEVRYGRRASEPRTKTRLSTKVKQEKEAARERSRSAPAVDADAFAVKKVAVTLAVLRDQIGVARRLVEQADPASAEYPGFLFRLANLYLDEKAIHERQAGALYEKIHALKQGGHHEGARTEAARQKRLQDKARQSAAHAVAQLAELTGDDRFRKYARRDESLYMMAFELGQLGRVADMQTAYTRLLTEHPDSKYRPHVYVAFADHKFDAGKIDEALTLYDKVVEGHPDSPLYAYALYKTAWCHLNPVGTAAPQYARSLDRFVKTIAATRQGRAGSEANARQLRREARRDLVRAFVHAGRPSKAWALFDEVGQGPTAKEDMARTMMELLAGAYFGEGMYVESTSAYRELQTRFSDDPQVCNWQAKIVLNALATDDAEIQWKETERLARTWEAFTAAKHDRRVTKQCRDATRDTLAHMGTVWHDEASKTGRDRPWQLAGQAYAEFLRLFPKDREAYELAFYLAETHWARAERLYRAGDRASQQQGLAAFRDAHDAFVRVLELRPDGKLTREAAFAQMLAMKNHLEYDETAGKVGACRPQSDGTCVYRTAARRRPRTHENAQVDAATRFPAKDYDEPTELMLQAYARYERFVKERDDPELPKILYHRGKLMVEHNRFADARPVLERLVKDFDGTRYAAWSAEMLLDLLTIRWADTANDGEQKRAAGRELVRWAERLEKTRLYRHEDSARVREQVPRVVAAVRWTEAEGHREDAAAGRDPEGYDKCAEIFVDIYESYDDHDRADELLFNAARCFEAAHRVGNAITVRKVLLERHPESKLYKQTLREVAENYQAIAYYEDAAERLELYAERYPEDDYAAPALENAFLFRRGLGDSDEARDDLASYERIFRRRDPAKAAGIFWAEHALLEDDEARLRHATELIERYGKKAGWDRLAVAHAAAGDVLWRRSCRAKGVDGDACVTVVRRKATAGQGIRDQADGYRQRNSRKIPARCGSQSQAVLTVHARDAKLAAAAQEHFAQALAAAKKADGELDADRGAALRDAVGMAMVRQADRTYEAYLAVRMPEGLELYVERWKKDSGVRKWEREHAEQVKRYEASKARFQEFFADKQALGKRLVEAYAKVQGSGSPHWTLAAAARTAVLSQNFADQLYRAEVPRDIRTEEQYEAYCDELADVARPLEDKAKSAFEYCLARSTEYAYFNAYSRACEEEMQQREPDRFPATNELFGQSVYTDSRMDRVPVQAQLPSGGANRR